MNQDQLFLKLEQEMLNCNLHTNWNTIYQKLTNLTGLSQSLWPRQVELVAMCAYQVRAKATYRP